MASSYPVIKKRKEENINIREIYVFHCLLYHTFRSIEFTMAAPKNHGLKCYLRRFQKSVCSKVRNAAAVFHFNNRQPICRKRSFITNNNKDWHFE